MTEAQGQATPEAEGTQAQPEATEERSFTQADLNKIAAKEKREGRTSYESELLERTGAESIDDVLSAYTEYQDVHEATTTEVDRANTRAERLKAQKEAAETKATEATTRANQRAVASEARVQALQAGVKPERVTAILRLSDLSEVEVDDDGEPDAKALKSAITASLKDYPEFKAGASVGGSGSNPAGGNGNEGKNPWTQEHFNLTQQGTITLQDPAKAERLRQAAQA